MPKGQALKQESYYCQNCKKICGRSKNSNNEIICLTCGLIICSDAMAIILIDKNKLYCGTCGITIGIPETADKEVPQCPICKK